MDGWNTGSTKPIETHSVIWSTFEKLLHYLWPLFIVLALWHEKESGIIVAKR
jgi:hypothetical protein